MIVFTTQSIGKKPSAVISKLVLIENCVPDCEYEFVLMVMQLIGVFRRVQ